VRGCIDYASAVDRLPSVSELCTAAHVSHRPLGVAFSEEFESSPSVYFRTWALERAHRRLRDAVPGEHSVTDVASSHGFDHLGRFAGYYRRVYGETPFTTLQAAG
jgi:AraC family ethanolamine operon transcriptional activator